MDADDRPESEIKITGASVFVNPYKDMEEEERQKADAERKQVGSVWRGVENTQGQGIGCVCACVFAPPKAHNLFCSNALLTLCKRLMQAEKEAGPLDTEEEGIGNWYSNPAGAGKHTSAANGSGVGKYLSSIPKKLAAPSTVEAAPDIPAAPAAKKQKLKQAGYGNFDAW